MKTASQLLNPLNGFDLYATTRGTSGDNDGLLRINKDVIEEFENACVCTLLELKDINAMAYSDCKDYKDNDPMLQNVTDEEIFIVLQNDDYIITWEQE